MQIFEISRRKPTKEAVISGGPTPAEMSNLNRRIQQATAASTPAPAAPPVTAGPKARNAKGQFTGPGPQVFGSMANQLSAPKAATTLQTQAPPSTQGATPAPAPRPGAATPGVAARAGNYAKGLATALGYSWGQAASQKIGSGVVGAGQQNPYGGGNDENKAKQAAAPLIRKQAEEQQKLFNQAVLQYMSTQGVRDPAQLDSANKAALAQNLQSQIQKNFLQNRIKDWKNIDSQVDPSQASKAQQLTAEIQSAVDAITDYTAKKNTNQQLQDWMQLSQATVDAMILTKFHPPAGQAQSVGQTQNTQNPNQLASTFAQANLTAADLGVPAGYAIQSTGNANLDAALTAMGVTVK